LLILDEVAYHDYGVPASAEECEALGRTCQNGTCVVLLNHGLLALGPTVHGTFMRMYTLERACELELIARGLDEAPLMISAEVIRKAGERMAKRRNSPDYGLMEWQGVVRTVDRQGGTFRT
jgi:ribulose-5-phosphate 4-epimerase/fuculose-1-phosphate aldolase